MPLYRVLRSLAKGRERIPRNSISLLRRLDPEAIQVLLAKGSIARVAPPPLTELPGWERRARRLRVRGIVDAEQFLEADDAQLAEALRQDQLAVTRLREEVIRWLQPDGASGCCG